MPKISGRKVMLYKGAGGSAVLVAGGVSHSIKINNEPLDGTDKSSGGWRELVADVGVRSVDVDFEGRWDNATLVAAALAANASTLLSAYEIRVDGVGTFAGDFFMSSLEIGSPHDDLVDQSGSLMSSGVIAWTAL
jgi:predicted secreted protein